jgi:hypothetical protein
MNISADIRYSGSQIDPSINAILTVIAAWERILKFALY